MDNGSIQHLERLIVDMKESLERDISSLRHEMNTRFDEVNHRFDTYGNRVERHGALIQTGSRWTNRMNQWAERVDSNLTLKDKIIGDLSDRVRKLEEGRK